VQHYAAQRRAMFYPKADAPPADGPAPALSDAAALEALPGLCRTCLGEGVRSAAPLGDQGTWHRLFRVVLAGGREVIARFNARAGAARDYGLLLDRWANEALRSAGIPALEVYAVDLTRAYCPWDYALMAPARSACLRDHDNDEGALLPLLRGLGAFLAEVHRIPTRGYGLLVPAADGLSVEGAADSWSGYLLTRLEEHLEVCQSIAAVSGEEARLIRSLFGARGPEAPAAALLHGDPGSHNAFGAGGAISCLIDWEDALAGDPAYEVAFWATFHPERRHPAFFEGYFDGHSPSAEFMERFWTYFLRVALAKTVVRHNLGLRDRPGRPPASRRIQLALDRLRPRRAA